MTRYGPALALAITWPTIIAWLYFVVLAPPEGAVAEPSAAVQVVYAGGKVIQFLLPILCVRLWERAWPRPAAPSRLGLEFGIAFGLLVAAAILGLYFGWLRDSSLLAAAPYQVRAKVAQFGITTPAGYLVLAFFIAGIHSLLEEYYWRWFVFRYLRMALPLGLAIAISSLAFMSHHVIVLMVYLPERFWTAVVPFSLCVAAGGAVWAWLYERTGSLYAPWLSHLLVDVAIMAVGYDMVFSTAAN